MPAKKKSVYHPLHLLQQLSHSLIEHLDKACSQAIRTPRARSPLQKQRGKAQDKLTKARAKLDEAGSTGKPKAQTKARARLGELEESLTLLQTRQSETLNYLAELKRDAEHSLKLAQGIRQVADAADQALQGRQQPTKPAAARARRLASPRRWPPNPVPLRPELPQPKLTVPQQKPARPRLPPSRPPSLRQSRQPRLRPNRLRKRPPVPRSSPPRRGRAQAPARSRAAAGSKAPASAEKKTAASAEAPDKAAAAALQPRPQPRSRWRASQRPSRRRSASSQLQLSLQRRAAQDFQRGAVVRYRDEGSSQASAAPFEGQSWLIFCNRSSSSRSACSSSAFNASRRLCSARSCSACDRHA